MSPFIDKPGGPVRPFRPTGPGSPLILQPGEPFCPLIPWGPCSPCIEMPRAPRSPFGPGGPGLPIIPLENTAVGLPFGPGGPGGPGGPATQTPPGLRHTDFTVDVIRLIRSMSKAGWSKTLNTPLWLSFFTLFLFCPPIPSFL